MKHDESRHNLDLLRMIKNAGSWIGSTVANLGEEGAWRLRAFFSEAVVLALLIAAVVMTVVTAQETDLSKLTSTFGSAAAILLGIFTFLRSKKIDRSAFYLEKAVDGYKEAYDLLSGGSNDRVIWIAAARILKNSKHIAERITEASHKRAHAVKRDVFRLRFNGLLGARGTTGNVTPSFWYGADPAQEIDEAAAAASAPSQNLLSDLRQISEKSIRIIFDFSQFPETYEDPLRRELSFSRREIKRMRIFYPALADYLHHRDNYFTVAGKLKPRDKPATRK